jgi:hypothetical protein
LILIWDNLAGHLSWSIVTRLFATAFTPLNRNATRVATTMRRRPLIIPPLQT